MTCPKLSELSQWQKNERKQRFKALEKVDSVGVSPDGMQRHNEHEESSRTVRSLFPEWANCDAHEEKGFKKGKPWEKMMAFIS